MSGSGSNLEFKNCEKEKKVTYFTDDKHEVIDKIIELIDLEGKGKLEDDLINLLNKIERDMGVFVKQPSLSNEKNSRLKYDDLCEYIGYEILKLDPSRPRSFFFGYNHSQYPPCLVVRTRTGGNNYADYESANQYMIDHLLCIDHEDSDYDNTYHIFYYDLMKLKEYLEERDNDKDTDKTNEYSSSLEEDQCLTKDN